MAYNIIAETSAKLDFNEVHKQCVHSGNYQIELFPMPNLGFNGGDAVGICIAFKNANESTWNKLKPILETLRSNFSCDVYDLYGGQKLVSSNFDSFKTNLLGE